MNIAVFASTRGTDFQAIIDEMEAGKLPDVKIAFLLTNKKDCGAVEKAKKHNIPVHFVSAQDKQREEYDREVATIVDENKVDLIVLVGWMRLFSGWFVEKYNRKIINIHPSLLPKYPGMDMDVHAEVIKNGEKETGMTIHYVDEGMDTGEIILQKSIDVLPTDTPESLKRRVQELEKKWYPEVIRMLRAG
jgi:formyltetrahydrofolate-dependent phosphoribosylglycinamide formyltransferase